MEATESSPLDGRTTFITGAARGIGRACAVRLAREGADIALVDIAEPEGVDATYDLQLGSQEDLEETQQLVEAEGRRALPIAADVRDREAMANAAERTVDELGGLDVLVANAGLAIWSPFAEMSTEQWQTVLDVNLTGVANSMWAVLPMVRSQEYGRIIAMSSVGGRAGVAGVANYAATKWGVIGLVKSVALEVGEDNVTVNAVCPTAVETPLYRSEGQQYSTGVDSSEGQDEQTLAAHAYRSRPSNRRTSQGLLPTSPPTTPATSPAERSTSERVRTPAILHNRFFRWTARNTTLADSIGDERRSRYVSQRLLQIAL